MSVVVRVHSQVSVAPPAVALVAATPGAPGSKREATCPLSGVCFLDLPVGEPWTLAVASPGYRADTRTIVSTPTEPLAIGLDLWPTTSVTGRFALPDGEEGISSATLRFQPSSSTPSSEGRGEGEVVCQVGAAGWSCDVPVGIWDVRIRARGFVSHYRRDVHLAEGQPLDVGVLPLRRGGSIVGYLKAFDGTDITKACRVVAIHEGVGKSLDPNEAKRTRLMFAPAEVRSHGFFHMEGLPPGTYVLGAMYPTHALTRVFPIAVAENAETELRLPVVLEAPLQLHLRIRPEYGPDGQVWSVALMEEGLQPDTLRPVGPPQICQAGAVDWDGLSEGSYLVEVSDSRGSTWARKTIDLAPGTADQELEIPPVHVTGTVRLGAEPIACTLVFGGRWGELRIATESNDDGRYSCTIPRAGRWTVSVSAESPTAFHREGIQVDVPVRTQEQRPAEVDILVPDNSVSGLVVNTAGIPEPRALVKALDLRTDSLTIGDVRSGPDGSFRLVGVPAGNLNLTALANGLSSGQVPVQIEEGRSLSGVTLRLRSKQGLEGTVTGPAGPVFGARVIVLPVGQVYGDEVLTDTSGRFTVNLPEQSSSAVAVVMASGYALHWSRVALQARQSISIALERWGGTVKPGASNREAIIGRESTLFLVHNGSALGLNFLVGWLAANGVQPGALWDHGFPQMPAGPYSPCRVSDESVGGVLLGGVPTEYCTTGLLTQGGELVLAVPERARTQSWSILGGRGACRSQAASRSRVPARFHRQPGSPGRLPQTITCRSRREP